MSGELQLTYYGNPILRKRAQPIEEITPDIIELAEGMLRLAQACEGLGLAANQVGRLERIFVFRYFTEFPDGDKEPKLTPLLVCINPKILEISKEKERAIDGCLSIPGIQIYTERPNRVRIQAQDLQGKTFELELRGYNARIFLHENDHLDGVLNIDHLPQSELDDLQPQLEAINRRYN